MLACDDASLYTGVTTDVARRLQEHQSGGSRAARYTRGRRKIELAYAVDAGDKSLAMRIEYRLRRLPAARKREVAMLGMPLPRLLNLLEIQL